MSLVASWLSRLEPVHVARTREEREAIYRFRYQVYVEELRKQMPDADHENRWLRADKDEGPDATLLYTGSADEVTSTARLRYWEPGETPAGDIHEYSMDMRPGIEKLRTAELG